MARPATSASDAEALGSGAAPCTSARRRSSRNMLKGRRPDATALEQVRSWLGETPPGGWRRDLLIEYLHRVQDACGALREGHLAALATLLRLPLAEVYEVATFYHHFDVVPDNAEVARVTVRVCEGLSCELAGGRKLLDLTRAALQRRGARVVGAPCLGRCEQAPAATVGQHAVPSATVDDIVRQACLPTCGTPATVALGYDSYRAKGGYKLLTQLARADRPIEDVLSVMEASGLRGLGGAGFPAGRKWRIVREQPAPRLLAVNLDEGEPGTFKDRHYLERDPHRFLEGMLIAAHVVGVDACYIYLRDEYHDARAQLAAELARLQAEPPCALPAIELRHGAGAYICGEESAMIESLEGKRGEPRMRPPYIAQTGLFGRPTLEHNFETLYWVRDVVERGADWFAAQGRHGRKGLRSFSVSGRVKSPGVKLAPAGITLRELVDEYCDGMAEGHELYAYLPGGASGGILPARLADIPLDFDTLQPHGCFIGSAAVIVLGHTDRARDAALNMMRFFANESCGQCTPCRVGTTKSATLMHSTVWNQELLDDLAQVMVDASICGLGQAAPNPMRCVARYFAHEVSGDQR